MSSFASNSPTSSSSSSSAVGTEVKTGDFFSSSEIDAVPFPSFEVRASPTREAREGSEFRVAKDVPNAGSSDVFGIPEFDIGQLEHKKGMLSTVKDTQSWRDLLSKGSCVDAQDGDQMWYEAVVTESRKRSVTVRFLGWSKKWNASFPRDSSRLAPRNSKVPNWRQTLTPGKCVEVSTSDSCTWCTAVVSIVETNRFQVIRAPACTTEWHFTDSPLIAEPYTHCGYKIEADARERRRMLAARRKLFEKELKQCNRILAMESRIRVARNIGEHLLGLSTNHSEAHFTPADWSASSSPKDAKSLPLGGVTTATAAPPPPLPSAGSGGGKGTKTASAPQTSGNNANFVSTNANGTTLLKDPPFADVTFLVSGERISAHKVILISRSAYFRRMFLGSLREAKESVNAEITLADISSSTFRSVIKYMYTGECSVNHDNALELLHAAHMFCLDGLSRGIESFLFQAVSVENAIEILIAAHRFTLSDLEEHCVEFIIDNYERFVCGKGFSRLAAHPQILISIMERIKRPKKRQPLRQSGRPQNVEVSDREKHRRGTENDFSASKDDMAVATNVENPRRGEDNRSWSNHDSEVGSSASEGPSGRSSPVN